jgi:small conductance mechanosensitive channel
MEAVQLWATERLMALGINITLAVLILIVGNWLANRLARAAEKLLGRTDRVDDTLKPLAFGLVRITVLAFTIMAVLNRFGVETTSVVAMIGAAGLAIGLALQGTLSNVAAGVMLLVLRPFNVGDAIEVANRSGTVKRIGLFTVELASWDNIWTSLPNSAVWGAPIVNFSRNPTRRVNLTIGIDYGDDIDHAMAVALEELTADERILEEPAPMVAVLALADSSINLAVRGHTTTADFWPTTFALQKKIKERFDAEGISIPFPQRTLHVPGGIDTSATVVRAMQGEDKGGNPA